MDLIQLLPDSVANQIAAGEVIQRPASVIKELVENAVDAGATTINILVVDAGRTSIQVIDNGTGMSITDARLAFERHATSKIRKADDLFSLHTMGFRGEALPSIAAVAQVTLRSRREEDTVGTQLCIAGSKVNSQEPVSCPKGSNFLVENLFFNVPVRRRFLKSNTTELNNIITAFQRIALVYPDITFTLHSNHQELFNLPSTTQHQRIIDVFGKKLKQCLLPVEVATTVCTIHGFVGTPESAHKKGVLQYFFVNGRYMKHPYFMKAVQTAYDRLVPQGDQAPFFLYFTMKPEDIDVNIHPTKTEIKFQDEQAVWQILSAAVREAVGRNSSIPTIDFDTEGMPDIPVFGQDNETPMPKVDFNPQYNPFKSAPATSTSSKTIKNWERLYDGILDNGSSEPVTSDFPLIDHTTNLSQDNLFGEDLPELLPATKEDLFDERTRQHYQYKGSYIITTSHAGLIIIDQERAHERVLFEQYLERMDKQNHGSQKMLFPEMVQFTVSEMVILPTVLPEIERLGFELTDLGGGSYAINAVPAGLEGINAPKLLNDMVATAAESTVNVREELFRSLASSMAHNAALPHGQILSNDEMEMIVSKLAMCDNYRYTPSGKTILHLLPHSEILKFLK